MGKVCMAAEPLDVTLRADYGDGKGSWKVCGRAAIATYRYACVHEHVRVRSTCVEHAPVDGTVGCQQCWDLGHDCPMTFEAVPDAQLGR